MKTPMLDTIKEAYGTLGTASGQAALQSALGSEERAVSNVVAPGVKRTPAQQMLSPEYHKPTKRTRGSSSAGKRLLSSLGGSRKSKGQL